MLKKSMITALFALAVMPAQAAIVSATGDAALAGSAFNVDLSSGAMASTSEQGYDELSGVTVADGDIVADYVVGDNLSVGDTVTGVNVFDVNDSADLGAGTYDSHILIFDVGVNQSGLNGTFTFSGEIVALILSNGEDASLLSDSDGTFGNASDYTTGIGRRVENSESIQLTSANTLSLINWVVGANWTDELRVITMNDDNTAPVPLPAGLPLMLAAFGGLAMVRKARKAA